MGEQCPVECGFIKSDDVATLILVKGRVSLLINDSAWSLLSTQHVNISVTRVHRTSTRHHFGLSISAAFDCYELVMLLVVH